MSANSGSSSGNPKRRKLTPFLCQEMLFDYALGLLDPDRHAAVESFLATDPECREILDEVRAAIAYAEELGQTRIRADIISHLRDAESAVSLGRRYASWKQWPESLRWSVVALAVSSLVAGVIGVLPWQQLSNWKFSRKSDVLELADLSHKSQKTAQDAETALEIAADFGEGEVDATEDGSGDEEIDDVASPEIAANQSPPARQASPSPVAPPPSIAVVASPSPPLAPKEAKPKGFVYRAFMNLGNLEELGPKIADHIVEFGGAKAGEVELGWKRGAGRYYHFSLPSENEEKLLEKLRAYGPVRISKDPHGRVMPQGQVRFILWVEPLNSP